MEGLIDTRNEYIEHIQDVITIPLSKRIYEIWRECSKMKGSIKEFQKELVQIKKWNNNIIYEEYKKIVKTTKCKYLADLIKNIIIITIKIKIYEYKDEFNNIKIKIPLPEDFIHKCYINISIFSWKNAYLFNNKNIKDSEYQNNLNIIEENFRLIIKKTFRDFIPFDDIFQQIQDNLDNNTQYNKNIKESREKLIVGDNKNKIESGKKNNVKKENENVNKEKNKNKNKDEEVNEDAEDEEVNEDAEEEEEEEEEEGEEEEEEEGEEEEEEGEDAEEEEGEDTEEDEGEEGEDAEEDEGEDAEEDEGEDAKEDEGEDAKDAEEEEGEDTEEDEGEEGEDAKEDEGEDAKEDEGEDAKEDEGEDAEEKEGEDAEEDGDKNKNNIITISNSINDKFTNKIYKKKESETYIFKKEDNQDNYNTSIFNNIKKNTENIFKESNDNKKKYKNEVYTKMEMPAPIENNNKEIKELVIDDNITIKNKTLRFF